MYRWVDHTAELELAIEGSSEREVLEEALAALAELLLDGAGDEQVRASGEEVRTVVVTTSDHPALLAGWLEELVFLAESEGFIATGMRDLEIRDSALEATVVGALGDPPPLIKAVTYHRLAFQPVGERFVGRVVLDV